MSELILWVSELIPLYFGCLNLYFWVSEFPGDAADDDDDDDGDAPTTIPSGKSLAHSAQG